MISREKFKLLLVKAFGKGERSRDGINFALSCPVCNDSRKEKKKLVVRLDDSRYHCWVCGTKGKDVRWLIKKYRPALSDHFKDLKFNTEKKSDHQELIQLPKDCIFLADYSGRDPDILGVINYLKLSHINANQVLLVTHKQ